MAASTQNVALCALLFLYRDVLAQPLPYVTGIPAATKPTRLPVVFTHAEVQAILVQLQPPYRLMAQLLYGSGLRLSECLTLRVKDLDIPQRQISVRAGKGAKDRVIMLPEAAIPAIHQQLATSRRIHALDRAEGYGAVALPDALVRRYPNTAIAWGWHYVSPATRRSREPRTAVIGRHHVLEDNLQRAMRRAMQQAGTTKHGSRVSRHYPRLRI